MSFKPYYKWITFNTLEKATNFENAIHLLGFKPYYKWITFNTFYKNINGNSYSIKF